MRRTWLTALAVIAAPLQAQPATTELETQAGHPGIDGASQAEDVKFRDDADDRLTVPVHLSGEGPFRFLVDTGADRTAISSSVAARLGLDTGTPAELHTMAGVSTVRTATVPDLQLSSRALTIDDAPVLEARHIGADGILGTDSLRSQRVVFDFEKRMMTIVPSKQAVPREEGAIVVTGRLRSGRLIVTNAKADTTKITVVLDTGSDVSVGNEALRRRLASKGLLKSRGLVQLQSVTGDVLVGEFTFVEELEMGDVTLANLVVVFADAHTFKKLELQDRPALLLGMNALRVFKKVSIDFANKKLRLLPPQYGSRGDVKMAGHIGSLQSLSIARRIPPK